jgi:hypothetical protein
MKWVVAAIAVFVVGYTLVNVYYRKPGPGHLPYEETNRRITAARLQDAGWVRLPLETRRPVEKPPAASAAAVSRGALGLGLELDACFTEKPRLLASIDSVAAPSEVAHGADYTVYFTGRLADQQWQLGELQLFQHDNVLVLVPNLEHLPGTQLLSRWNDANYCASFSTQSLPPGRYTMRIVANGPAVAWTMTVR